MCKKNKEVPSAASATHILIPLSVCDRVLFYTVRRVTQQVFHCRIRVCCVHILFAQRAHATVPPAPSRDIRIDLQCTGLWPPYQSTAHFSARPNCGRRPAHVSQYVYHGSNKSKNARRCGHGAHGALAIESTEERHARHSSAPYQPQQQQHANTNTKRVRSRSSVAGLTLCTQNKNTTLRHRETRVAASRRPPAAAQ